MRDAAMEDDEDDNDEDDENYVPDEFDEELEQLPEMEKAKPHQDSRTRRFSKMNKKA